eukprot:TRINITY_DN538_c0_g1_i8.p1 TRINITY_DN538_c0_g1~~TRINITY_DN538_c0_g1_i8.p1  ORF type:complete len:229 (-),score=37.30 TRINITY_DN538_c0_g1_i8:258-944(-)
MQFTLLLAFVAASGSLAATPATSNGTKELVNLRGASSPESGSRNSSTEEKDEIGYVFTEVPDLSGPPDFPGPYDEEPSDAEAESPKAAMENWTAMVPGMVSEEGVNSSSNPELLSLSAWWHRPPRSQFCEVHHVGWFCNGFTRVRCCRTHGFYVQCGTTAHAGRCGWHPPAVPVRPPVWHIHPGWHTSQFCVTHHTGSFCHQHTRIHCCNDHGHFVECNSDYHDSRHC